MNYNQSVPLFSTFRSCIKHKQTFKKLWKSPAKCIIPSQRLICTSGVKLCVSREDVKISRYPVPERSSLELEIKQMMKEVEEKTNFVPNVMKALSHRPEEYKAFFNYYDILMNKETGSLTKAEKELIVVATSASNNCLYCVVAHGAIHRIYSKDPYKADQVSINTDAANVSSREREIVKFALKVAQMEELNDEDFSSLEKQGLDREDAWDIGAITALFALSNRMAHLTAMRPNEEFYLMGRIKKNK